MTKEEFMKTWVKNPSEIMPNPDNRHKGVVTGDIFMKQLNEIISEAIADHDAKRWKKYPENKPEINREYEVTVKGRFSGDKSIDILWYDHIRKKHWKPVIAFRELPEPCKEGDER